MRHLRAIAFCIATCAALGSGSVRAAQPIGLIVNGTPAAKPAPVERGGVVFIPLRTIFVRLGASVDVANLDVSVSRGDRRSTLRVGSRNADIDGVPRTLDAAPFIIGDAIYVPLDFVTQALGVHVAYDPDERVITVGVRHHAATAKAGERGGSGSLPPPSGAVAPVPVPAPPAEPGPRVIDSVYETLTRDRRAERTGYGRYTYLLLMTKSEAERNEALLAAVMGTTPTAGSVTTPPALLNVFEIPESSGYDPNSERASDPAYALEKYDFGLAHDLVERACAAPQPLAVCNGTLTGPFLLTYGKPLESVSVANPPYLIVDLQRLNVNGFSHMVAMMKQQVKEADVADGHLVRNWSIQLLSTTLDIADWLPNAVSSARNIEGALVGDTKPH